MKKGYRELSFDKGIEILAGQWRDIQTGDEDKQ